MKNSIGLFIVIILIKVSLYGQDNGIEVTLVQNYPSKDTCYSYGIFNQQAGVFLSNYYVAQGKSRKRRSIHRFRHQSIEGVKGRFTLAIHEGIEFKSAGCCGGFCTYRCAEDRKTATNLKPDQRAGVIVYMQRKRNLFWKQYVIGDKHENELAIAYLQRYLHQ